MALLRPAIRHQLNSGSCLIGTGHSEKLNTQLVYCQVKKLIFVNPCGEKTYVLPYFSLYAGSKQVQVLHRPFVILSVEVYCKISFTDRTVPIL